MLWVGMGPWAFLLGRRTVCIWFASGRRNRRGLHAVVAIKLMKLCGLLPIRLCDDEHENCVGTAALGVAPAQARSAGVPTYVLRLHMYVHT